MKFNQWTIALAAVGAVSLASVVQADEAAKPSSIQTALSSTMISGYVDTSAQWNMGTGNANNPGYSFNQQNKADGFNLNVVKLTIEKDPEATDAWGAGYKVDLLFGPDANTFATQSTGTAADFAVKQAYVDLKAPIGNGLDFKIGVWDTIIGYEVFESGNNPNFTRSYGYTIEPTTHTGVQAAYQVNDMIGVTAGIADSFGPTINGRSFPAKAESFKTYMASVSFTAPTNWSWASGSTLYGGVINGFNSASPANLSGTTGATQTSLYLGSTLNTPLKELKVGAAFDYVATGNQTVFNGTTFVPVKSGYANAVGVYGTYQATEKLSLNGRVEYFSHSGGPAVVAVPGGTFVSLPAKATEVTLTAQYDLWKNVLSRVEFRWDHAADGAKDFGGTVAGAGTLRNAYELIANIIYKF